MRMHALLMALLLGQGARSPVPFTPTPAARSSIAWVGDSIIALGPPEGLAVMLAPRSVLNLGVPSSTTAQCATRWAANPAGAFKTLIWSCGVNTLATGATGAATWSATTPSLDAARAAGVAVIVTSIMPWKNASGWTAGTQTATDDYNTLAAAWASANGQRFINLYGPMGGQGGDAAVLLTTFDSGDHIHPNATGINAIAEFARQAVP